jgi:hypothetical protein
MARHEIAPGQQAVVAQVVERDQACLRRIDGAEADGLAGQPGQFGDRRIGA